MASAEAERLAEDGRREKNWKRWGPYLAERQWGTVREDYSDGEHTWQYFPFDHARSRAYRWGEDGLLGITDRECRLCFALALWNGRDPILKERLFGLSGKEGNHGEDVKECYFYLDASPTHSYLKALYKYPQRPILRAAGEGRILADHATLRRYVLAVEPGPDGVAPELLFTENETNEERLFGVAKRTPYVKDAFHDYVVGGQANAVNPART